MFNLINVIVAFLLQLPLLVSVVRASAAGQEESPGGLALLSMVLLVLYTLFILVPSLAVTVRRLHDIGKSGWWYLLNFIPFGSLVLLIFTVMDSQPGTNKWGPNPKGLQGGVPAW